MVGCVCVCLRVFARACKLRYVLFWRRVGAITSIGLKTARPPAPEIVDSPPPPHQLKDLRKRNIRGDDNHVVPGFRPPVSVLICYTCVATAAKPNAVSPRGQVYGQSETFSYRPEF